MKLTAAYALIALLSLGAGCSACSKGSSHSPASEQDRNAADRKSRELLKAAAEGNLPKVRSLLDSGADVNYRSQTGRQFTPLLWAVFEHNYEVATILLQRGADPEIGDIEGRKPVDFAKDDPNEGAERFLDLIKKTAQKQQ